MLNRITHYIIHHESKMVNTAGNTIAAMALLDEADAITPRWKSMQPIVRVYAFKVLERRSIYTDSLGYARKAMPQQEELIAISANDSELSKSLPTTRLNLLRNLSQWQGPSEEILEQAREICQNLRDLSLCGLRSGLILLAHGQR